MPLKPGSSKAVISSNIKTEKAAGGKSHAQSVAIALHAAGKPKKKAKLSSLMKGY